MRTQTILVATLLTVPVHAGVLLGSPADRGTGYCAPFGCPFGSIYQQVMSRALVSVFPILATIVGGQQSTFKIHFFVSVLLVLFLVIHIVMVFRAGFRNRVCAMITGRVASRKDRP